MLETGKKSRMSHCATFYFYFFSFFHSFFKNYSHLAHGSCSISPPSCRATFAPQCSKFPRLRLLKRRCSDVPDQDQPLKQQLIHEKLLVQLITFT